MGRENGNFQQQRQKNGRRSARSCRAGCTFGHQLDSSTSARAEAHVRFVDCGAVGCRQFARTSFSPLSLDSLAGKKVYFEYCEQVYKHYSSKNLPSMLETSKI